MEDARVSSHKDEVKCHLMGSPDIEKIKVYSNHYWIQVQCFIKTVRCNFVAIYVAFLPGQQCFLHTFSCFPTSR